jgi:hypothetical protein
MRTALPITGTAQRSLNQTTRYWHTDNARKHTVPTYAGRACTNLLWTDLGRCVSQDGLLRHVLQGR